jgi:hypothetical protein
MEAILEFIVTGPRTGVRGGGDMVAHWIETVGDEVYPAGSAVQPGHYIQLEVSPAREVHLATTGILPGSCDGRVAIYRRLPEARQPGSPGGAVTVRRGRRLECACELGLTGGLG